ncbi:hypothetical protein, partial [Vibrio anguillarum]|uniref:hypothetical protein n=1 Tax=Vibrio anguillarum TaxID=55601 RepID=UPI001C04FEC0
YTPYLPSLVILGDLQRGHSWNLALQVKHSPYLDFLTARPSAQHSHSTASVRQPSPVEHT